MTFDTSQDLPLKCSTLFNSHNAIETFDYFAILCMTTLAPDTPASMSHPTESLNDLISSLAV